MIMAGKITIDLSEPYTGDTVSRKEAEAFGWRRYFTGLPCPKGHVAQRYTASSNCVYCETVHKRKTKLDILKKKYAGDYDFLMEPKPDYCEACLQDAVLVFDHCHASEKFRGWICAPCNVALGGARDSATILRQLADFLERNNTVDKYKREITLPSHETLAALLSSDD